MKILSATNPRWFNLSREALLPYYTREQFELVNSMLHIRCDMKFTREDRFNDTYGTKKNPRVAKPYIVIDLSFKKSFKRGKISIKNLWNSHNMAK
jgi:hypothetical protein